MRCLLKVRGVLLAASVMAGQAGLAQTANPKPPAKPATKPATKPGMAAWSPDVQKALGVPEANFTAVGLNKLTQAQLSALLIAARPDPRKGLLTCPASGTLPSGRIKVFVTVAGDDSTGNIATAIRQSVSSLSEVDVVDSAVQADRALHVVIQEQTINKRTIGFTASYLTATPCSEETAGKKTDVELKGTLGTYTDAKGPDLAKDLAKMLDQELQPLRTR
jgi:hypothetical protein